MLPDRIAAAQAEGEYCLMAANGNIFETSWYMRASSGCSWTLR